MHQQCLEDYKNLLELKQNGGWLTRAGIPESAIVPIAFLELACLALYLIPRTMVLGAVLLTGYFGGAIVVRIIGKESVFPLILIGLWIWGGVYFRVPALQSLLPLRREQGMGSSDAADERRFARKQGRGLENLRSP
jgi:hypothetical protein